LANLDHFRSAGENSSLADWVTYNRDFHRAIAQLSSNARLTRMTQDVIDQFDRLTFMGVVTAPSDASSEKLVGEHCSIIDAIQARDKTAAGRLISGHVMKSQKRFFTVFENPPIIK
jgi:DNA-binding GntR family transcriptional regulator